MADTVPASLRKAPYCAVKMVLIDLGTCGGVVADEHARVRREDGSLIEGLYAIGNTAGNAFGATYPGAGATIGQVLVYGCIAGRHAAANEAIEAQAPASGEEDSGPRIRSQRNGRRRSASGPFVYSAGVMVHICEPPSTRTSVPVTK